MKPKKKVVVKKRSVTSASVLRDIKQVMKQSSHESSELWNILTALRGPDSPESLGNFPPDTKDILAPIRERRAKAAVTLLVRRKVLGQATTYRISTPDPVPDSQELVEFRRDMPFSHFRAHGVRAFESLGLLWHAINPEPKKKK